MSSIKIATDILKSYSSGNLNYNILSNIKEKKNKSDVLYYIIHYIKSTVKDNINANNYKLCYYFELMEYIVMQYILLIKPNENENFMLLEMCQKITAMQKGQLLLNRLFPYIMNIKDDVNELIIIASKMGTIATFEFWLKHTEEKCIENMNIDTIHKIFINSIGNSDDRLFNHMVKKVLKIDKLMLQKNSELIQDMISSLSQSNVPKKYILKRIKLLSQYISLVPYFQHMIRSFFSYKIILELHKHYYVVPHTFDSLSNLVLKFVSSIDLTTEIDRIKVLESMLKTKEEKTNLYLLISIIFNINPSSYIKETINISDKMIYDFIDMNLNKVFEQIDWEELSIPNVNPLNRQVIKVIVENNFIHKYVNNTNYQPSFKYEMLFFNKFVSLNTFFYPQKRIKTMVSINFALHRLRLLAKKKKKANKINYMVRMFDLLSEIKTFEPNNNVKVLAKGSEYYQISKQRFSNIPPRHLMPGEIIETNFLIKEKADGILINNLPTDIYPPCTVLFNYMIKAEYIEELDLYLVFDIDIPNLSIIERYNVLRNAHYMTHNTRLVNIDTIDDFVKVFEKERENIITFLKEKSSHDIKWYPKFACHYMQSSLQSSISNQIINIIHMKNKIQDTIINSMPYKCDGIIISPLNGDREIKVKPIIHMTIDLLYDGCDWVDRENNIWSHIIKNVIIPINKGCIYRCYYINNNMFEVREYRYDKKRANPRIIVDMIICNINYNWKNIIGYETFYYDTKKRINNKQLIEMLKEQSNNLVENIMMMEPQNNMNWLDLGCGSGKLIPIIKKYNIKNYLGLDADIKQLLNAIKYNDMMFNPCNLNENWNEPKIQWLTIPDIKFDYIVANFSLMHFCTDIFWQNLDKYTTKGSKFMFNLVNTNEWEYNNSYLKPGINGNMTKYFFEWTHSKEMEEPYINMELLAYYLKKYNWDILYKNNNSGVKGLSSCYDWYIAVQL